MYLPNLSELQRIVKRVASNILKIKSSNIEHKIKLDGSSVTTVDQTIQDNLLSILREKWPNFGFIGEEMDHEDQIKTCQQSISGYWVLDPLDGTTNFISGFHFYGISLALVIDGYPVLAVVYDPIGDECFYAEKGNGAYMNGTRLSACSEKLLSNCIANIDYKRLVGDLATRLVRAPPYRSQRNLGASVLEWCWLAAGRFQLYLDGGQQLWDFSAGYLILMESGGAATSLSGRPLDCSQLKKRSVVAAVNADLLTLWLDWITMGSGVQ